MREGDSVTVDDGVGGVVVVESSVVCWVRLRLVLQGV